MAVLQERRTAYGQRCLHHLYEHLQVGKQPVRQSAAQEAGKHLLVRDVAHGYGVEFVRLHELVKDVRAEHQSLGDVQQVGMLYLVFAHLLYHAVQESQATALASQRTFTDAGKVGILVEAVALEHRHNALVLHPAVCHDGIQDYLSVHVYVLLLVPCNLLQELGNGEEGTAGEPAAHVVVPQMVLQGVEGQGHDVVLQFLQIVYACHLVHGGRVAEHEVAETEVSAQQVAYLHVEHFRVLVHEVCPALPCQFLACHLARLHDKWHVGVAGTYAAEQFVACHFVLLRTVVVDGETAIGDDAQGVVGKLLVQAPCLLIGSCQHNLWASAHAQGFQRTIQRLGGEGQRLVQDVFVQVGQNAGVEAYRVLHHQEHLHTCRADVVLQVHLVLDEFDDTEQQFRIAKPAEYVFECRQVLVLHPSCHTMAEGCEHHDGDVGVMAFHTACNVEHVVVLCRRHTDNQIYVAIEHLFSCLGFGGHLYEAWREAKAQFGIFRKNLFVYASVVLQHEGIVGIGYEQYVADAFLHQVNEGSVFQLHVCMYVFQDKDTFYLLQCALVLLPFLLVILVLCQYRYENTPVSS